MRAPRASFSGVAARNYAAVSSSSSVARAPRLPELRGLSPQLTPSTQPTSSASELFQDLVHHSLRPVVSSLNPFSAGSSQPAIHLAWSSAPELDVNPATAGALQFPTGKRHESGKPKESRMFMILRLIRNNRILSAMTAFEQDMKDPSRSPFTLAQLECMLVALRIQSRSYASSRPSPMQPSPSAHELWRPARLDPSISAKSLPIPIQCMYAMSAVYDVSIELKHIPTAKMVSALLATFATTLAPEALLQAAHTAMTHLFPPAISSPRKIGHFWRNINLRALSTFIRVFGRSGAPEEGERFLKQWAQAQRANAPQPPTSMLEADVSVDLSGWGHNVVVWQSLIRSRVDAGHLQEARQWLDRYRLATKQLTATASDQGAMVLPVQPEPYLEYMTGIRNSILKFRSLHKIKRAISATHDLVKLMAVDHVPIDSSILAFVLDFDARCGDIAGGASLVNELSSLVESMALSDPALIRSLLRMRQVDIRKGGARASSSTEAAHQALPSTRFLIQTLVRVGENQTGTSRNQVAACRSRGTLNEALVTAVAERDYPAVIAVLNLFERWRITLTQTSYSAVLTALVEQDHHRLLLDESSQLTPSDSIRNLESTLASLARSGNGDQADAIRRAVGDQVSTSEGVVASAQPSTTLRQTQYLVRVLNRVCAAEITAAKAVGDLPAWVVRRPSEADDAVGASPSGWSGHEVRGCVIKSITAAQDELLGPRETREDCAIPSIKAPLFAAAPLLSPRRKSRAASTKAKSVRGMCTSVALRSAAPSGMDGESCGLAAKAAGDHTHLEPVRTIYIPGFVPYDLGLALQEHLVQERAQARQALRTLEDSRSASASTRAGLTLVEPSASEVEVRKQAAQDTLLLLQHRPVYTEGRREERENQGVAEALRALGADYRLTKRGGQITYHGPGQLVGYPILNLGAMGLASRCYVDRVQDSLVSLLRTRGVETVDPPDAHTGVWADEYHKIASIGIQVRHRVSSHGFALNVEPRAMRGFRHIVACGIVGRNMTCLHDRLDPHGPFAKYNTLPTGDKDEDVQSIAHAYVHHFADVFGRTTRAATEVEFGFELTDEDKRQTLCQRLGIRVREDEQVVRAVRVGQHRVE